MRVKKMNRKMTALTLMVALGAAVYLNWSYAKTADMAAAAQETEAKIITDGLAVETAVEVAAEESTESLGDKTYGEAQLVSVGAKT
ncbi:MAG: hypothetical protein IIV90_00740, partial [Oscillospiraceae bacterium]|nr:hypothetical protein [Oscillospiraceae bacterium]